MPIDPATGYSIASIALTQAIAIIKWGISVYQAPEIVGSILTEIIAVRGVLQTFQELSDSDERFAQKMEELEVEDGPIQRLYETLTELAMSLGIKDTKIRRPFDRGTFMCREEGIQTILRVINDQKANLTLALTTENM